MRLSMKDGFRTLFAVGLLATAVPVFQISATAQTAQTPNLSGLIAQLFDQDPEKRFQASVALRKLGPEAQSAATALTRALRDEDPRVAENAAWTLAFVGSAGLAAVPTLTAMVRDSDEPNRVPAAAVLGLMRTSNQEAVKALTEALTSGSPELRRTAAAALGALGQAALPAVPALARATRDEVPAVRSTAIASLGRLGGFASAAVPTLREIEAGKDAQLKSEAVMARQRIESELARPTQPAAASQPAGPATTPASNGEPATATSPNSQTVTDRPTPITPSRVESGKTAAKPEPITLPAPVVKPVQIISQDKPRYTSIALERKISGTVVLSVEFLASGKVGEVRVISGLGFGLDDEAVRAAKRIRFNPAEADGKAVDRTQEVRYRFNPGQ
jgi:TonB family protein